MKPIFPALLLCLMPLATLPAQQPAAPAAASKEKLPYEIAFSNLPEKTRIEYLGKVVEAKRFFNEKRIFEAVDKANEANAIFSDDPEVLNLIGACQVEFRNFEKAMEAFKKADAQRPNNPQIFFNIAELNFVTGNWQEAEANLTKVLKLTPATMDKSTFQVNRLTEFKLLLAKLKLNKRAEAVSMATKYDYLDDSPYHYYAAAALLFDEGKDVEAEGVVARGTRIFQDANMLAPWQDTMIEFGYIKGFFGGAGTATPTPAP